MIVIKSILFEYNDNCTLYNALLINAIRKFTPFRFEKRVSGAKKGVGVVQEMNE